MDRVVGINSSYTIITDLDDTLKISHSLHKLRTVFRGLFTNYAYSGMSDLFQAWDKPYVVVSSSPTWIIGIVKVFLSRFHFPKPKEIILRDWIKEKKVKNYKYERISAQILSTPVSEQFILLGDDSEYDPEIYSELLKQFPDRILKVYIRPVRGRKLPPPLTPFYTAYDIALSEWREGRLSLDQVIQIGDRLLSVIDPEHLIPHFAFCPKDLGIFVEMDWPETLKKTHEQLNERMRQLKRWHQHL